MQYFTEFWIELILIEASVRRDIRRNDSGERLNRPLILSSGRRTEALAKEWQKALAETRARAPSVLFFDDLDALCGVPSGQEGVNGSDNQYLSKNSRAFIEFVERAKRAPERILILASSKSWSGLSDILTKTRGLHLFEEMIEIKPPSAEERAAIFKVSITKRLGSNSNSRRSV